MRMFDRKYPGAWGPVLLHPFLLSAHSLYVGQRSGPRPLSWPGTSGSVCRQPDTGLQPRPSGAISWLSDIARGAHKRGDTTGWQSGARAYRALNPISRVGRAFKEEGRGLSPKCQPRSPPARIRTHREGREGKAGRQEPSRACRRFGSSKSDLEVKLHSSVEHGVTLLSEMDVPRAFISSCSGRIKFNVVLGTE